MREYLEKNYTPEIATDEEAAKKLALRALLEVTTIFETSSIWHSMLFHNEYNSLNDVVINVTMPVMGCVDLIGGLVSDINAIKTQINLCKLKSNTKILTWRTFLVH